MTNKKNQTIRIFAWLGAIVFAIFLAFMPFMVNNRDKNLTYAADDVSVNSYTFHSSFLYFPCSYHHSSDDGYPTWVDSFNLIQFNFIMDSSNTSNFQFYVNSSFVMRGSESGLGYRQLFRTDRNAYFNASYGVLVPYTSLTETQLYDVDNHLASYEFRYFGIRCPNVMSVPVRVSYSLASIGSGTMYHLEVHYFDIDDNFIDIFIDFDAHSYFADSDESETGFISYFGQHDYYFSSAYDFSDNSYYQQGYSDGLSDGDSQGFSRGFADGYSDGYSVGERTGFNQGVQDANTYSFLGLFGAIVDAPLQAFTGLFDFNLSFDGVHNFNLKGFFLAILTISLVIAIIRFAMSR